MKNSLYRKTYPFEKSVFVEQFIARTVPSSIIKGLKHPYGRKLEGRVFIGEIRKDYFRRGNSCVEITEMEKKKTNRVRMYLMLSGLSILLTGCTQINENEENVSQLETEETTNIVKTDSIIEMEINEEQIDLTPERFFFQPDENVICVYEGTIEFDSINDKYALYKETAEKDIVFVNMLFVENETGMIYTWEGENLVSVSMQEAEKLDLPGNSELESEHDWLYENIPESELLSKVMEMLKETGHSEKNLIYDGTIDFIHRSYYMVSAFENFEDHIVRGQTYYIDRKNGYLYRAEEEPDFLRTELYYIGDFITETIQSFSVEEMRTFKKNHSVILCEEIPYENDNYK